MKAIFLDIDGVLNGMLAPSPMHWNSTSPDCIECLNEIIDATGAKVFMISSWVDDVYFVGNNPKLEQFLYDRGVRQGSIVGFRRQGAKKEEGIMELVQAHQDLDSFIIIDDNPTILTNEYMKTRYLQTESLDGLTKENVQTAIQMLSE